MSARSFKLDLIGVAAAPNLMSLSASLSTARSSALGLPITTALAETWILIFEIGERGWRRKEVGHYMNRCPKPLHTYYWSWYGRLVTKGTCVHGRVVMTQINLPSHEDAYTFALYPVKPRFKFTVNTRRFDTTISHNKTIPRLRLPPKHHILHIQPPRRLLHHPLQRLPNTPPRLPINHHLQVLLPRSPRAQQRLILPLHPRMSRHFPFREAIARVVAALGPDPGDADFDVVGAGLAVRSMVRGEQGGVCQDLGTEVADAVVLVGCMGCCG